MNSLQIKTLYSFWLHTYSNVIFDITTEFYCSLLTKSFTIDLEEDITTIFSVVGCQRNSEVSSHTGLSAAIS